MTVAAVNDRVTIGIDETKRRGDERTAMAVSNSALHGLQKFSGWRSASTMEGREQPSDSAAEATWDPFLGTEMYSWAVALQLELGLDVGVQHPPRWLAQT